MFRHLAKHTDVRDLIAITKALADPSRLRILAALRGRELCVCQVTELLRLAPSTISKHLALLQRAGLAASRKTERWVYYRGAGPDAPVVVREALDWVTQALGAERQIRADRKQLQRILKANPSTLCQRQNRR